MNAVNGDESASRSLRRRFTFCAAAIVVLGLAVRIFYVWMATVEYPIRGDVNQYVLYAWNLSHRGVFSTALPDAETATPDDYRGPGYPAFLAATMTLAGHSDLPLRPGPGGQYALGYASDTWMRIALGLQVVLGTLTVSLVIAIGRFWLPPDAVLATGLATALWPHLVTFTGVLLSETLFAFSLAFSFWLLCKAQVSGRKMTMATAGFALGLAYLVNPVIALFPLIVSPLIARRSGKTLAVAFLAAFVLAPAAWALRSSVVAVGPGSSQRALENFVQGSWPQYHAAYNTRSNNEISRQISAAIDQEVHDVDASTLAGVERVFERMSADPAYYLTWYLFRKPYLLWDWSVRVGSGDIYFLPVEHSPFEHIPVLSAVNRLFRALNPSIFLLAAAACIAVLLGSFFRSIGTRFAPLAISILTIYLTGIHVLLQAEPRYSVPYRPEELLLAATFVVWFIGALRRQMRNSAARWLIRRPDAPLVGQDDQQSRACPSM